MDVAETAAGDDEDGKGDLIEREDALHLACTGGKIGANRR
jgi:hypothetical protein